MFCNKGRIKISSFFLFPLAEDGEDKSFVAGKKSCRRCCRLSAGFSRKCRDVFLFFVQNQKNFVQKIFGTRQAFRNRSLCMRKMLKKLRQSSAYFLERRIFVK